MPLAAESNGVALRYRAVPDHLVGEIMSKKWIDNAIALLVMVCVVVVFGQLIPEFFTAGNRQTTSRQFGEFALVCVPRMIVGIVGGSELSRGPNFAPGNFLTLALLNLANLPLPAVIPIVMLVCAAVGLVNGVLIGYLRLRAFLTTLV